MALTSRLVTFKCLKVVAYVESKLLADALAKRLADD
jgi:hypothetical protein